MKSPELDALAERKGVSTTDAVRLALQNEWEQASGGLAEVAVAFCRDLRTRAPRCDPQAVDKDFIDRLYDDG